MLAGVTPEEIDATPDDDMLNLIRSTVLWGGEPRITLAEVAARSGLDIELCRRARMMLGLPDPGDEALCRTEEVEVFTGFATGIGAFGVEPVLAFTRVLGAAMASVGEGALSVFARAMVERGAAGEPDDGGGEPLEQADLPAEVPTDLQNDAEYRLLAFDALTMFGVVPQVLQTVSKLQFDQVTDRLSATPGQIQDMAVGFVDLTSSTRVGAELGVQEMSEATSRFEERAVELAVTFGGRVVKFIGDEVMYVAPNLEGAVEVARGLLSHVIDDPALRGARAGVAHGEMLGRDGDWFGTTVNIAARLVERAKDGEILCSGEGAEDIEGVTSRTRKRLRGLDERIEIYRIS